MLKKLNSIIKEEEQEDTKRERSEISKSENNLDYWRNLQEEFDATDKDEIQTILAPSIVHTVPMFYAPALDQRRMVRSCGFTNHYYHYK